MMNQSGQEGMQVKSDALHGGWEPGGRGLMHQILYVLGQCITVGSGWEWRIQSSHKSDVSLTA